MKQVYNTVSIEDFEMAFGEPLSPFVKEKIKTFNFNYLDLDSQESQKEIINTFKHIFGGIKKAGKHRVKEWDLGWGENRDHLSQSGSFADIIPRYFGKFPYVRWNQTLIKPQFRDFEYNMLQVLQYWLFEKYFQGLESVYEFGCGTGHNLLRVEEVNPTTQIYGLDWAQSSQETIELINKKFNKKFQSKKFNFFDLDKNFQIGNQSGVFTFAALEQSGSDYKKFIEYLIAQKPEICVHIEPIAELLDPDNNLMDFLSVKYFEERNYLNSFYNFLKEKESDGLIEIIQQQRTQIGSYYIDGYSVVVWRIK
jgi:SAM-dependent methyltransferase